ncbi:hypothetical protein J5N97_023271 [Dioscorea zingiberensis]|uniref:Inhibitor of growth protein n=1 Tax=Dioscorea zingiberensis TaxID=325984 RepID=A0A9D5CCD9_9LILI|nr:hypothetical protein J5N97_023271 [Dioscorea zingiberensis]
MGFMEDFQASLESLPAMLQRNYSMMHDLDKSLQGVQRQNEQRCEQEMENIRQGIESGNMTPDSSLIRFSDEAVEEQKHCIRIADEKVALAVQAYDMVDAHIQQLDQYMRKLEEIRKEKELAASAGANALNSEGTTRSGRISESSRGGRKKTRLAAAAAVEPISMDLELPVDPNEPTYCFCNQVSFGEMVACDNPDCKIEWFHFGCVGLKEHPKGKWITVVFFGAKFGAPKVTKDGAPATKNIEFNDWVKNVCASLVKQLADATNDVAALLEQHRFRQVRALGTLTSTEARAFFVFGDSLVDNGNNNFLATTARADAPPYGIDYPTHLPTGRFSNGLNMPDIISEYLGAESTLPYLSPELRGERLLVGANFASAGIGILNDTGIQFLNIIRITKQLEYFQQYQQRLSSLIGPVQTQQLHVVMSLEQQGMGTMFSLKLALFIEFNDM